MKFTTLVLVVVLVLVNVSIVFAISDLEAILSNHHEEITNSMYVIDKIFSNKKGKYLEYITTSEFKKSKWYKILKKFSENSRINFNHRVDLCEKDFIIENTDRKLIVVFQKKCYNDNLWFIEDAYLKSKKGKIEFDRKGFTPLSTMRFFGDLLSVIATPEKLFEYLGLSKYGKINNKFIKNNKLILSKKLEILSKNIIIYVDQKIKEVIYLKFKYYQIGYEENGIKKSGWLLTEAGPMSNIYKNSDDIYVKYLLGQHNISSIHLAKPNDLISKNLSGNIEEDKKTPKKMQNYINNLININKIICELHNKRKPKVLRITLFFDKKIFDLNSLRKQFDIQMLEEKLKVKLGGLITIDKSVLDNINSLSNCSNLKFLNKGEYLDIIFKTTLNFNAYTQSYLVKKHLIYIDINYR